MKKIPALLLMCMLIFQLGPSSLAAEKLLHGYEENNRYEYVTFGSYPTDADGTVRPILWRVLKADDETAYLLTEYILEAKQLHHHYDEYESWETSDLYVYLNGEFKEKAFTAAEQLALINKTEDMALVTLINSNEMKDASIGFANNKARLCESTEYAKDGLYIYSAGHKYSPWWSRTRSTDNPDQQRRVMNEGKIGRIAVTAKDLGMRPAINIDLNAVEITAGAGSMEDPFVLTVKPEIAQAAEEVTPIPSAEPTASPETEEKVQQAAEEPTAVPETEVQSESGEVSGAVPQATANAEKTNASPLFPELAEDGYLPEGAEEFVLQDEENGIWLYASQTLRVEIHRRSETEPKLLRWYEAEIFCKPESDMFRMYAFDKEHYTRHNRVTAPQKIAKQHNLVFAVNGDFFIYRVGRKNEDAGYRVGVVIRDGNMMYDIPRSPNATVYPPLDVMALYGNGDVKMFKNGESTGEALVQEGAHDALSFGPILVKDGQIAPGASAYGEVDNPRSAFGIVEPGHYYCVMLEGRMKKTFSQGSSCIWMAETMQRLGCKDAINLDGGQTACMLFMGERINKIGTYDGKTTDRDRPQNELLGIGQSSLVNQD